MTAKWLLFICPPIFFLCLHVYSQPYNYTRPPPRSIVFTQHDQSESHPQQVHISLAGKDWMRISWITEDRNAASLVEYGSFPGKYEGSATGESTSYRFFFYKSGKIHHVKIGPLLPNKTYYYRCGGIGDEFTFRTPPPTFPIHFVVAGDLGQTEWTASTLWHIKKSDYDVLLLPGDLSYADHQQPLWDSFGRMVDPLAKSRPWMVTQGNHEIEKFPIIGPPAFKSYNSRWRMPYEESGSTSNLYYSFNVAGTHVIMLGSYTDFDVQSTQYSWLQEDLSKVDRKKTPWLLVLLHAPWYNTNLAHQGEGESMREAMEELLFKARVDIIFSGHVHAYERFSRVYNNSANPCGPIHMTIGDGGNREGLALLFKEPTSPLSLFREASFGHGRLSIHNNTHARWVWLRNDDSKATVGDELWVQSLSGSNTCDCSQTKKSSPFLKDEL